MTASQLFLISPQKQQMKHLCNKLLVNTSHKSGPQYSDERSPGKRKKHTNIFLSIVTEEFFTNDVISL